MSCGCGCGTCGDSGSLLSGLMGESIVQAANFPVNPGARFQFGFNVGYFGSWTFAVDQSAFILEQEGLAYDAVSYRVAGALNVFVTIEGNSVLYWDSALELCNRIRTTLEAGGVSLDAVSIQCNVERFDDAGSGQITPVQYPSNSPGNPAVPRAPDGTCNYSQMNAPDWLACKLGVTTSTSFVIGGIGALIGVLLISRIAK